MSITDEDKKELLYQLDFFLSKFKNKEIHTQYWNRDEFIIKLNPKEIPEEEAKFMISKLNK
jgi:hypothetical protein